MSAVAGLLTVAEVCAALKIGRTKLNELLRGTRRRPPELRSVLIGSRRLVRATDLQKFLDRLAG